MKGRKEQSPSAFTVTVTGRGGRVVARHQRLDRQTVSELALAYRILGHADAQITVSEDYGATKVVTASEFLTNGGIEMTRKTNRKQGFPRTLGDAADPTSVQPFRDLIIEVSQQMRDAGAAVKAPVEAPAGRNEQALQERVRATVSILHESRAKLQSMVVPPALTHSKRLADKAVGRYLGGLDSLLEGYRQQDQKLAEKGATLVADGATLLNQAAQQLAAAI